MEMLDFWFIFLLSSLGLGSNFRIGVLMGRSQ
jgi:hypothetical protein